MTIGITQLAHSLRLNTVDSAAPIPLSRGQQLVCAALGHKSFASFQAGQGTGLEPLGLEDVACVVPDYELLATRAQELGLAVSAMELRVLIDKAFKERLPKTYVHGSYELMARHVEDEMQPRVLADAQIKAQMSNANYRGIEEVYFENGLALDRTSFDEDLTGAVAGQVTLGGDPQRPYSGNQVKFRVAVTVARLGRRCFDATAIEVLEARLDPVSSGPNDRSVPSRSSSPPLNRPVDLSQAMKAYDPLEQAQRAMMERETFRKTVQSLTGQATIEQARRVLKGLGLF